MSDNRLLSIAFANAISVQDLADLVIHFLKRKDHFIYNNQRHLVVVNSLYCIETSTYFSSISTIRDIIHYIVFKTISNLNAIKNGPY